MSSRAAIDLLTVPIPCDTVKQSDEYLATVSPKDKPWDRHRGEADDVAYVYAGSPKDNHHRYAERVTDCSQVLEFARDPPKNKLPSKLKLKNTWFCRVRHCPVCQWRRSLCWQAKVYQALPRMVKDYPGVRFLFMTLTVRNCKITELRNTLSVMGKGWERLTKLRCFPGIGWVRSVEITRGKDGSAHPHYHCLLMVRPMYFGAGYLTQAAWVALWQKCLRIHYKPIMDIRVVVPDHKPERRKAPGPADIWGAVVEILKYSVKPSDMVKDHKWFLTLVDQVWKTKAVIIGGVFKKCLREREKENLLQEPGEEPLMESYERIFFGWQHQKRRYVRKSITQSITQ